MPRSTRQKKMDHWKSAMTHLDKCLEQIKNSYEEAQGGEPIFDKVLPVVVQTHENYKTLLERVYDKL